MSTVARADVIVEHDLVRLNSGSSPMHVLQVCPGHVLVRRPLGSPACGRWFTGWLHITYPKECLTVVGHDPPN